MVKTNRETRLVEFLDIHTDSKKVNSLFFGKEGSALATHVLKFWYPGLSHIYNLRNKEKHPESFFKMAVKLIQSTLVISTSVISNNRLSRTENLILVLT